MAVLFPDPPAFLAVTGLAVYHFPDCTHVADNVIRSEVHVYLLGVLSSPACGALSKPPNPRCIFKTTAARGTRHLRSELETGSEEKKPVASCPLR